MTSQVQDVILLRSHRVTSFHPFVSDQRRPLASDPFHISNPGSEPTPHRGRVQPPDNRARRAPSPRGWTSVFLIGPCRGWRGYAFKRCDRVEDGEQRVWGGGQILFQQRDPHPDQTVLRNICPDCRQVGAPQREGRPYGKWRDKMLCSCQPTEISFVFRDSFVRRDLKAPFGQKIWTLRCLRPCCIIVSSRSGVTSIAFPWEVHRNTEHLHLQMQ